MNKKLAFIMMLIAGIALMSMQVLAVKGVNITDSEIVVSGTGGQKVSIVTVKNIGDEKINVTFQSSMFVDSAGHSMTISGLNRIVNLNPGQVSSSSFTADLDNYAGNYTGVITARVDGSSESDSVMAYIRIQANGMGMSVTPNVADSTEADTVITQKISVQNFANRDITGTISRSGYSGLSFSLDREGAYTFPAFQTTEITATVVVPAGADSKAYTGNVQISTSESDYSTILQTIVEPTFKASVPQLKMTLDPGATVTGTMVIYNTGNVDLTGLSLTNIQDIVDSGGNVINITVTPSTGINVPKGGSASVQVRAEASSKMESGEFPLQMMLVGSGISTSANALVTIREPLQIIDVELNDDKFRPGDTIRVSVDVENVAQSIDLRDVEVTVYFLDGSSKLRDDDSETLQETSSKFNLYDGDSKYLRFEFIMPYSVSDGDKFTVYVEAKARNADDSTKRYSAVHESLQITVEKEDHKLEFFDVRFDSDTLSCLRSTYLRVGVRNIGNNNEDEVQLSVTNAELGISRHEIFDLDKKRESSDDFERKESFLLNLPDAVPGTYSIKLTLYYDRDNEKEEMTIPLTILACSSASSGTDSPDSSYTPPSAPSTDKESVEFTYSGTSGTGASSVSAAAVPPRISSTKKDSSWTDSIAFLVIVGLGNVLLVIAIIVAVSLLFRKS